MLIPFRRSARIALLAFASAAPLLADDGQWANRFWGLGWGDGYHAPPRSGGLHLHGLQGHGSQGHATQGHGHLVQSAGLFGGQPSGLMPGGYPYRGPHDQAHVDSQLPEWLWDPTGETVIVDSVDPSPSDADPVPVPPASSSSNRPSHDPSLGLPPSLAPTEAIDSRAMNRRSRTQARSNGWSR